MKLDRILTIFSIILAVYLYIASKSERKLNYYIPIGSQILSIIDFPNLKIAGSSKTIPITNNVYKQDIYIWNSGKLSIKTEDIIENILIKPLETNKKIQILKLSIDKKTNNYINEKITIMKDGNINLTFDILDQLDGIKIGILYQSENLINFAVMSKIKEQGDINPSSETFTLSRVKAISESIIMFFFIPILLLLPLPILKKELKLLKYLYVMKRKKRIVVDKFEFFHNLIAYSVGSAAVLYTIFAITFTGISDKWKKSQFNDIPQKLTIKNP